MYHPDPTSLQRAPVPCPSAKQSQRLRRRPPVATQFLSSQGVITCCEVRLPRGNLALRNKANALAGHSPDWPPTARYETNPAPSVGAVPADRRLPAAKQTHRPRRALSRLIAECPLRNKPNGLAGTRVSGERPIPRSHAPRWLSSRRVPYERKPQPHGSPSGHDPPPEAARIPTPTRSTTIYYSGQCCRVKVIIEIIFNNPIAARGAAREERVQSQFCPSPYYHRRWSPFFVSPFWRSDGRYALKSAARPVDDGPVRVGYGRASKVSHQGHSLGAS